MNSLPLYGYGLACIAYTILFLLLLTGWRARFQGSQLLMAVGASALWSLAAAAQAGYGVPGLEIVWATEVVRNLLWLFFVLHLLKPFAEGNPLYTRMLGYVRLGCLLLGFFMLVTLVDIPQLRNLLHDSALQRDFSLIGQLLYAVLGMALVEQLFRNTRWTSAGASSTCALGWVPCSFSISTCTRTRCCFIAWTMRSGQRAVLSARWQSR